MHVFGKWINLEQSCNGHFMLPLTESLKYDTENVVLHTQSDLTEAEIDRKALKLHRQFAHCAKAPLVKMLRRRTSVIKD